MLASMRFATVISLAGTRISVELVTSPYRRNFEMAGMLLAQGDAATEEAKLHRVATDRRARVLNFGPFNKA
jgi:hypothetical protein